jgi:serine/threonine protein kinase
MIIGVGKKGQVSICEDKKYGKVAIKYYKQGTIYGDMFERIQKEVKYLLRLKELHEAGIFPGEIYVLKTNISTKDKYDVNYIKNKNPYIIMKYYEQTLLNFTEKYHAKWIYKSIIFQIIAQLIVIHKYMHIYHRDLHSENILITRCAKSKITYLIGDKLQVVPTYGYLVAIIDFDSSRPMSEVVPKPELDKIEILWHNICYSFVKKDINNNLHIIKGLKALYKNADVNAKDYKKVWGWYIKTGKIDRILFKTLLSSGFDYSLILDSRYSSLVTYMIELMNKTNIKKDVINLAGLNLSAFGYEVAGLMHSAIDYKI